LYFSPDDLEYVYLTTGATCQETEVFVVAILPTLHLAIFCLCEQRCVLCVLMEVAVSEQRVVRSLLQNPTPLNNKLNETQVDVLLEEALAQVPGFVTEKSYLYL
jgi:hypothetical protein